MLVNNAAGNFLAPTEDLSPNAFDAVVRIVLHGSFHCTRELGRRWIERGTGGQVLSIVTTYAWTGSAFVVPSACAKAGVLAMTKSLAVEWATYGIRLNAIAPGLVRTPMSLRAQTDARILELMKTKQPLAGSLLDPDDIARAAVFLLGPSAQMITGQVLGVDGGWEVS